MLEQTLHPHPGGVCGDCVGNNVDDKTVGQFGSLEENSSQHFEAFISESNNQKLNTNWSQRNTFSWPAEYLEEYSTS